MKTKKFVKAGRQTDRIMPAVFSYQMLITFFVLLVATGVFCGSVSAYDDIHYAQNLSDALNISYAGAAYANGDTVYLVHDVALNYTINITAERPITLKTEDSASYTISRDFNSGYLFNVIAGTFILAGNSSSNLIIDGNMTTYSTSGNSLVYVNGGELNMSAGSVIQNSNSTSGSGVVLHSGMFTMTGGTISDNNATSSGAVRVDGGTFTMTGGDIFNNNGGFGAGVSVKGGSFNMGGGNISGNNATIYEGGGVYVNEGTFNMTGGTISDNTAVRFGGGVHVCDGTFTMSGGNISDNAAVKSDGGGVSVGSSGTFTMTGGNISENDATYGGGVRVYSGTFTMTGGEISNNNATKSGGGVYVKGGSFNMGGGTISDNNATDGGGVYVMSGSTFNMTGGMISDNNAVHSGGGVYVNEGTFTMSGGNISDNNAVYSGGVCVYYSTFNMNGGDISNNNATIVGGGIIVDGTFNMTGSATIDSSNDVYMNFSRFITVTGDLGIGAGALNITTRDTSGTVIRYNSGISLGTWTDNFALNQTWASEHPLLALGQSGNDILLGTNCTVNFSRDDTSLYLSQYNVSGALLAQPAYPTKLGYTFNGWNITNASGTPWDFTNDRVTANLDLYANWTKNPTPTPTTSGGGGNTGYNTDAGATSPDGTFTTDDGGLILQYPAGSSIIVTVFPNDLGGATAPSDVSYLTVYDVHSTAVSGTSVNLEFRVNASELENKGLNPEDISILHYFDGEWYSMMIKSIELVNGEYQFAVSSTHTSPFMVAYNVDVSSFPLEVDTTPTSTQTTGPTVIEPTVVVPTTTQTETPSSPVPFIGIIAGLGAVVLLMRKE